MDYASSERVMFEALAITGCRIATLDCFQKSKLHKEVFYFRESKTGKYRKESLPRWYIEELFEYWQKNKTFQDRFFACDHTTLRRYFNANIRPHLSAPWREKRPRIVQGLLIPQHRYQLKGLRKNFGTLEFKRMLDKWKDANVALQFTSKRFGHSTERITAHHYIQSFESLDIERYKGMSTGEILDATNQPALMDFY